MRELVEATKVAQKATKVTQQVLQAGSQSSHSGLHRLEKERRPRPSSARAVEAQSKHLTCLDSAHSQHIPHCPPDKPRCVGFARPFPEPPVPAHPGAAFRPAPAIAALCHRAGHPDGQRPRPGGASRPAVATRCGQWPPRCRDPAGAGKEMPTGRV